MTRSSGVIWKRSMYSTNRGTASSASQLARYAAHATSVIAIPRYIGLRVYWKTPELTRDDADAILIGLTVVFARRNDTMPEIAMPWPTTSSASASPARVAKGTSNGGTSDARYHIRIPIPRPTAGGGILCSRNFIWAAAAPDR